MTDRHAKTAKDIMDNACLPLALASVSAALRASIEQALRDERREAAGLIERLVGALEPFGKVAEYFDDGTNRGPISDGVALWRASNETAITIRNVKDARAALKAVKEDDKAREA